MTAGTVDEMPFSGHLDDVDVYAAEERAWCDWWENEGGATDEADDVAPTEVAGLLRMALDRYYDDDGSIEVPSVIVDVPDDGSVKAFYRSTDQTIHVHGTVLDRWTMLHELAHHIRHDGHGPQFRAVLVGLVVVVYGQRTADVLRAEYASVGLDIDDAWL